jgi:hypothetical protein
MSNDAAIKQLEENIKTGRKFVELGQSLERLRSNRDFKKLILEGYFEQEAIRLVHLKADPSMQTQERQASIVSQMDAIGSLSSYFNLVLHKAAMAEKGIAQDEQTIEELSAEELTNG